MHGKRNMTLDYKAIKVSIYAMTQLILTDNRTRIMGHPVTYTEVGIYKRKILGKNK